MATITMNAQQYDIVKRFLNLGVSPMRIATEWKAPLSEVIVAQAENNYEAFKAHKPMKGTEDYSDTLGSMFGALGL